MIHEWPVTGLSIHPYASSHGSLLVSVRFSGRGEPRPREQGTPSRLVGHGAGFHETVADLDRNVSADTRFMVPDVEMR